MSTLRLTSPDPSPARLFEATAQLLLENLIQPSDVGEALSEKIIVEADTGDELLKAFWNALINLLQNQRILFRRVYIEQIDMLPTPRLRAEVRGELLDPYRHHLSGPGRLVCVKAQLIAQDHTWIAELQLLD